MYEYYFSYIIIVTHLSIALRFVTNDVPHIQLTAQVHGLKGRLGTRFVFFQPTSAVTNILHTTFLFNILKTVK